MTYEELKTNIMDPFLEVGYKSCYAAIWYNGVLAFAKKGIKSYGKDYYEKQKILLQKTR